MRWCMSDGFVLSISGSGEGYILRERVDGAFIGTSDGYRFEDCGEGCCKTSTTGPGSFQNLGKSELQVEVQDTRYWIGGLHLSKGQR